jgi:hypothetical protein
VVVEVSSVTRSATWSQALSSTASRTDCSARSARDLRASVDASNGATRRNQPWGAFANGIIASVPGTAGDCRAEAAAEPAGGPISPAMTATPPGINVGVADLDPVFPT